MTMDERIEAAARAYDPEAYEMPKHPAPDWDFWASQRRSRAVWLSRAAVAAAFPELSGDKPGWIAPWEASEKMRDGARWGLRHFNGDFDDADERLDDIWGDFRDAYLGKELAT